MESRSRRTAANRQAKGLAAASPQDAWQWASETNTPVRDSRDCPVETQSPRNWLFGLIHPLAGGTVRLPLSVSNNIHKHFQRDCKDGARPWTNYICRLYFLLTTIKYGKGLPRQRRYKDRIKDAGQASFILEDDQSGTAEDKACRLNRREARPPPSCRAGSSPIHLP